MTYPKYCLTVLLVSVVNLVLNAVAHFAFLKDFYESHPAVSAELQRQIARPPDQLVGWAMVATTVAFGLLITTVIRWSGAATFSSGLRKGFVLAFLFWTSVNFGLYASSHLFSLASVFVDLVCSITAMTLSGAVAAWMLGRDGSIRRESGYEGAAAPGPAVGVTAPPH